MLPDYCITCLLPGHFMLSRIQSFNHVASKCDWQFTTTHVFVCEDAGQKELPNGDMTGAYWVDICGNVKPRH